ncbi:MAG: acyl-CoA/acyl-ACP dehydrogenase [Gammaproteobacteria bacterium]|nr:acyl-CoA/acyl-ACP dehydrogenase [Gammaproteobacteria bacterium]
MEFALSEEQLMMQDSVTRYLADRATLDTVRGLIAAGPVHDAGLWSGLAGLGICGLLVPQEYGGAGMTLLDAMLVQEVLGRHVVPVSFIPTSVLAPLALLAAGTAEQKQKWLPAIAEGRMQVAVGLSEACGARDGAGVTVAGAKLSGRALFVLGAADAAITLLCSSEGDVYAVEQGAAGLERTSLRSIDDTQCLGELNLHDVTAELLPAGEEDVIPRLLDAGRVMLAADILGAAQKMLELAVAYSLERKQFNRLIGSFQAVKHLCAEMAAELEPCRSLVWYAAHAYDAVPEESRLMACHAKAHLAEVGRFVARSSTEVHGGMGFTDLLGLHYWFKRIGCNRQLLGGPERVREEAARVQGWI